MFLFEYFYFYGIFRVVFVFKIIFINFINKDVDVCKDYDLVYYLVLIII